jgi:hypothetical protein
VEGIRSGKSMGEPILTYLFAAEGAGEIRAAGSAGFAAVELPKCGVVAVPSAAPEWEIADGGGLELIRITARWPEVAA